MKSLNEYEANNICLAPYRAFTGQALFEAYYSNSIPKHSEIRSKHVDYVDMRQVDAQGIGKPSSQIFYASSTDMTILIVKVIINDC